MRLALFLALVLAVPLAAAEPAETIRQCSANHCVVAEDRDGEGEYDWANVATVAGEQVTVNLNYDAGVVLWHVDLTSEELGGHEAEEIVETLGIEPRYATLEFSGESNATLESEGGMPEVRHVEGFVYASLGDHETGVQEPIAFVYARLV